jgi:Ca2+-binding RTX toxin-like protein
MRNLVCDLEPRLMLYSFTLSSGVLRLYCDTVSQDLSVTISGSNIQATLMQGSVMTTQQQWVNSSVSAIFINADEGNDRVKVSNKIKQPASIAGGAGNDTIISGGGNDLIGGGAGDDVIDGGGGSDTMSGGNGFDTVDYSSRTADLTIDQDKPGGDGEKGENDSILYDFSRILCGTGNDTVHGTSNTVVTNYIWGNEGNDSLWGGDGNDTLVGSGGNDNLYGEGGRDLLYGETGKDRLYGGSSNDTLKGGKGIDQLFGEKGSDKLYDRDGYVDLIDGGADTDSILDKDRNDKVVSVP